MQQEGGALRTRCGRQYGEVSHADLVMACESLHARVEGLELRCAALEHARTTNEVMLHGVRKSVEELTEATSNTAWELSSWDDLLQWAWRAFSACIQQWRDRRWSSKRQLESSDIETGGQMSAEKADDDAEIGDGTTD